jgi:UDP-GlcNAc3NAcA epimerase
MKIVTILGARPQFIKAGSVSREILNRVHTGLDIQEVIVQSGQHYDVNMSDIFFDEMKIPKPDYFLGIGGITHGAMTGQMIEKIEGILVNEKPDWVLIYGDTNSTLAGAIAASKLHIKIAHIEAGLRSNNMRMPEEINRILADRVSSILFCPTQAAVDNLNKESISAWGVNAKVVLSGDVMQDGALYYRELSQKPSGVEISKNFVLCTVHRAENTDAPVRLKSIIAALNQIAKNQQVILPLHPRTRKILLQENYDTSNLTVMDPVGYLNMVWLIDNCSLVMTDSGGLQKEAYFFSKPCITLRDETEWTELVVAGANKLVSADTRAILDAYTSTLSDVDYGAKLYGSGDASKKIVDYLIAESDGKHNGK